MFAAWRSFVAPDQAVYFSASPEVERFSRARRDISSDFARVADVIFSFAVSYRDCSWLCLNTPQCVAFFVANAGRSLLPGHEASGAVTPPLKDEEA